jgi:hypothetical protein
MRGPHVELLDRRVTARHDRTELDITRRTSAGRGEWSQVAQEAKSQGALRTSETRAGGAIDQARDENPLNTTVFALRNGPPRTCQWAGESMAEQPDVPGSHRTTAEGLDDSPAELGGRRALCELENPSSLGRNVCTKHMYPHSIGTRRRNPSELARAMRLGHLAYSMDAGGPI